MKKILLFLLVCVVSVRAFADAAIPVQGKVYEGNLNGIATLTFDFKSDSHAVFTMSLFGKNETKEVAYEQNGSTIVVHAQNGDMTLTQGENNILTLNINGQSVHLECQTPENTIEKVNDVAGHVFSGAFGNGGRLTLSFELNGSVSVSVIANNRKQEESWSYSQNEDTITLTEPMGRKITLRLNAKNELKGMFTIVNVTLPMVE